MPEVSRFYGIVIKIFYDDHHPPHFHAEYGEHEVLVSITTLAILSGSLPARALGMVTGFVASARTLGRVGAGKPAPTARQDCAAGVNLNAPRIATGFTRRPSAAGDPGR